MQIKWKQVQNVKICVVGTIRVASVSYNDMKSRGAIGKDYRYTVLLPGFKDSSGTAATEEAAQANVETMINNWFKAIEA